MIVVDVGAPSQPGTALDAAAQASVELDVDLALVGDESSISAALRGLAHDGERLRVVHAPTWADRNLPLADALALGPQTSIDVALAHVSTHPGAALVSAGHASLLFSRATTLLAAEGVPSRPAMAALVPTVGALEQPGSAGFAVLLDIGVTAEADADDLVAWARMGASWFTAMTGEPLARVALLAHNRLVDAAPRRVREADASIRAADVPYAYLGLRRADTLVTGVADVFVTDGFTGNALVRGLEGVAGGVEALAEAARSRWTWRVGMSMLSEGMARVREHADWQNYGGAPILGLRAPVVVTQSSSGVRGMYNAIRLAQALLERGAISRVVDDMRAARNE